jgi:hypothetical protein
MNACEFAAIGWLILLLIALYTNQQANRRETRKEIRDSLNQMNAALDALLDASTSYYLDKQSFPNNEIIKIHNSINVCYRLIEDLSSIKKGIQLHVQFHLLYEKVTGGNFESEKLQPGQQYTELCKEIATLKESLIINSEKWYKARFQ